MSTIDWCSGLDSRYFSSFSIIPTLSLFIYCSIIFILIQWFQDPSKTYTLQTHMNLLTSQMFPSHIIIWFSLCMLSVLFSVYTYESVKSIWITINNIVHEFWTICDAFRILFISSGITNNIHKQSSILQKHIQILCIMFYILYLFAVLLMLMWYKNAIRLLNDERWK